MPFGPVRPRLAPAGDDADLAAILRRCAAGDPDGTQALRAWQGGRIGRTFARFVKDPELAEGALEAALADLCRGAAVGLEASGLPAEDWVFGRLRRLAQEAATGRPAEPPNGSALNGPAWRPARGAAPALRVALLRAVVDTGEEPSPEADHHHRLPEVEGADAEAPAGGVGRRAVDEAAGETVPVEITARAAPRRRPSVPRMSDDGDEAHVPPPPSRLARPRRLLRPLVVAALGAAAATAGVLVGLRDAGQGSDIVVAPSPAVVPSPAPAASPSATRRAASLAGTPPRTEPVPPPAPPRDAAAAGERAAIGGPAGATAAAGLPDPELAEPAPVPAPLPVPPVVARQEPPPPAAPPAPIAAPLPASRPDSGPGATPAASGGGLRVFVHHAASDQTGAALARQLADQLRREGYAVVVVRQVRFRVTAPGVRYFFAADREAAGRLLRTSARFVAPRSGQASRAPADFTHHQPKPRAGTLEVWIGGS